MPNGRQLSETRLRQRTSLKVLPKLTSVVDGTRRIIDDPPLIGHVDPEALDASDGNGARALRRPVGVHPTRDSGSLSASG
jgi:hypothetical protein